MQPQWIEMGLRCPDCKLEITITQIAYSADGEWRFSGKCSKCHRLVWLRNFATYFAYQALRNDIERCHKPPVVPTNRRLTPPLAIPPEKLSEEDKQILKDFGIDPDSMKGEN